MSRKSILGASFALLIASASVMAGPAAAATDAVAVLRPLCGAGPCQV